MRIILNAGDTDNALDHLVDLIATLRADHTHLRRAHHDLRDGYPRHDPTLGRTSPTNELDDDGTPIPQRSDPVARIVIDRDDPSDTIGLALATVVAKIQQARRLLESAATDAAKARPPITPTDPGDLWCTSCLRWGVHEPRAEDRTLCTWCRDEQSEHGELPSRRLVEAHTRGRISPRLRAEIAARDAEDRARKKTDRRRTQRNG